MGPPPDLHVIAWSPKQSIVSPHLHLQSLLKRGMPNQCLRTAENWLSSKYLNDRELGAAESHLAALSDETDRSLAFSLAGKSGFESVRARRHLSMHDEKLFCRGCWVLQAPRISSSVGKSWGNWDLSELVNFIIKELTSLFTCWEHTWSSQNLHWMREAAKAASWCCLATFSPRPPKRNCRLAWNQASSGKSC